MSAGNEVRYVSGSRQQVCDSLFGDPNVVAPALRAAKSADVQSIGGNARVQFYAMRYGHHYATLAVTSFPGGENANQATSPIYAH